MEASTSSGAWDSARNRHGCVDVDVGHGGFVRDRAVLAELLQARTALRRYGVNVNQAVAALSRGPVWLLQAVSGCARAADRMDEAKVRLTRRLA